MHTGRVPPARRRSPSREELLACADRTIPSLLAPDLDVVFCGINPGLYSAWTGLHFARPGNRFWPALHGAAFTPRRLQPAEQDALLRLGVGITNIVERATATAAELGREELAAGARRLEADVERHRPACVAVLGVTAYRAGFDRPGAVLGPQEEGLGPARLWVLPNPSGLNAHYQLPDLVEWFARLRADVG